jgi:hypothetical protein
LYFKYALAEKLNKTLQELESISFKEFQGWLAYFELKKQKENNG